MAERIVIALINTMRNQGYRVLIACGILLILSLAFLSGCAEPERQIHEVNPGTSSPDFTLTAVRGGSYNLHSLRGKAVLLSFINTQSDISTTNPDPSRAQIVFLKSMFEQYGPKGLVVLIVDASQANTGKQSDPDELINFTYNWQLDTIPVLVDEKGIISNQFGVSSLPTTFLIGMDGVIQQRWDNWASASQLALAIEAIIGAPIYRTTDNDTPTGQETNCAGELIGQAKFSGVGLARSMSDEIWVVDKGKPWNIGGSYPLQWIVLDYAGKFSRSNLYLIVSGHYPDSEDFVIFIQPLELLPEDEARGLVGATGNSLPNVYFLTTEIALDHPGCLSVQAIVFDEETDTALYQGEMLVAVE
jgi:peroxiredoxin